ncbi:MAG: hypothetical protein V2A79_05985 [Planctomycetota bacterium]
MRARHPNVFAVLIGGLMPLVAVYAAPGGVPTSQPSAPNEQRDDDLSKKLIRKATTGAEPDIMTQVTSLMSDAQERLVRDLDPGPETQAVQRLIVSRLDEAIKTALQQRLPSRARQRLQGERRELPDKPDDKQSEKKDQGGDQAADPGASVAARTAAESEQKRRGAFRESRRGWGHLPQRDREELLQGIEEEFVEPYRPQIEQYYRALTEGEVAP